MSGAAGDDTFYFDTALNAATNVDTIIDFATGNDHISLLKAGLFANLSGSIGATLLVTDFNTAAQTGGHIVYDTGNLYYDADGGSHTLSGAGTDSVLFASLIGNPPVATDFIIG
ncbi:hypothetical protein LP414_28970 [Polaromonas sp. P1(28)-13]|nr:hypothetical protein LP414_28970 [Polaromonas sp. P1(28)-13]